MWHKYTAKWGVQMPGMNFQTRSRPASMLWLCCEAVHYSKSAKTASSA
ncbi:DUF6783 domain-containing protein [Otoolea muris]